MNTISKVHTLFELKTAETMLYKLAFIKEDFIKTTYTLEEGDVVNFTYDITDQKSGSEILAAPLLDKLRFLINAGELVENFNEFVFTLNPQNLYFDFNLKVRVLEKDVLSEEQIYDFISEYRALVGAVLNPKYSFEDYLNSEKWLHSKNKIVYIVSKETTVQEMIARLCQLYEKEADKTKESKLLVNKAQYKSLKVALPICIALMIIAIAGLGYLYFIELPFKNSLLAAENAFLVEDYSLAIDKLQSLSVEKLPKESKYQLAKAFIISESLNQQQKQNILQGISMKSTDDVLDFWIQLGRIDYEKAIDTAQRMRDDELLLYTLLKYQVAIENDNLLTGEEKTQLLEQITSQISKLEKDRTEKLAVTESGNVGLNA